MLKVVESFCSSCDIKFIVITSDNKITFRDTVIIANPAWSLDRDKKY